MSGVVSRCPRQEPSGRHVLILRGKGWVTRSRRNNRDFSARLVGIRHQQTSWNRPLIVFRVTRQRSLVPFEGKNTRARTVALAHHTAFHSGGKKAEDAMHGRDELPKTAPDASFWAEDLAADNVSLLEKMCTIEEQPKTVAGTNRSSQLGPSRGSIVMTRP